MESEKEIFSSREIDTSIEKLYRAFSDVNHLKNWWGPEGFTNTIYEFDLREGGNWRLTMHGPEKGNYENASVFIKVEPFKLIRWRRVSKPLFEMEIEFNKKEENKSEISFRMIFDSVEECNKIKPFAATKNEENFDRLEIELKNIII